MITNILQTANMSEIIEKFKNLLIILLYKYETKRTELAIAEYYSNLKTSYLEIENLRESHEYMGEEDFPIDGKMKESPFFKYFHKLFDEIKIEFHGDSAENVQSAPLNIYKNEKLAIYILNYCMPFIPLCTGLILHCKKSKTLRLSNANVECWFKIIKHNILQGDRSLKIGRFIEETKKKIEADLKSLKLHIGNKPKSKIYV